MSNLRVEGDIVDEYHNMVTELEDMGILVLKPSTYSIPPHYVDIVIYADEVEKYIELKARLLEDIYNNKSQYYVLISEYSGSARISIVNVKYRFVIHIEYMFNDTYTKRYEKGIERLKRDE